MPDAKLGPVSLERMVRAVEKVRERLLRATAALDQAGVPYAVAGGNAVAAWVSRIDEAAVRNTQDVDILLRRWALDAAARALEGAGFVRHVARMDFFLDGPDAKARDAVHVIFAGEKVRPEYVTPAPDVVEAEAGPKFSLLNLEALVRMALTSCSIESSVHVRDLIDVGLVDDTWHGRLPAPLAERLRELIENPEG